MSKDDIKYIKLRTKNAKMMLMYGDKLTKSEWARSMRTNGLHTEMQHSDRYGGISQSCTMSDGCNGHRFKMIGYSHPYRWSTVRIPVTAEQEARLFAKGCEMADIQVASNCITDLFDDRYRQWDTGCWFGPNHIKYDKGAAFFSFISKRNIWKPSKTKMICNRACGEVLMSEWSDIFDIVKEDGYYTMKYSFSLSSTTTHDLSKFDGGVRVFGNIPPHEQTPDQTEYLVRHYFDNLMKEQEHEQE